MSARDRGCIRRDGSTSRYQAGHAAIVIFEGTLENGRLDGWDSGVSIGSGPHGANARNISRMTVTNMRFEGVNAIENDDTVSISWSLFRHAGIAVQGLYGSGFDIQHTAFIDNASGVDVTEGSDLTITDSAFTGSAVSSFGGQGPVTLTRDVFLGSKIDGVHVTGNAQPVRVGRNLAVKNNGHGLVFTDNEGGVTDLGGNRASRNATDPQCVGVVCR